MGKSNSAVASKEEAKNELAALAGILTTNFKQIEACGSGNSAVGIPVDFHDFDAMTQGLQRGDLIVLGGRPAMGKTSLGLNMARNVAQSHGLPVCIFGLEMSKEQLTNRLLSMEVGIESGRLRTGRLEKKEWSLVSKAIENLGKQSIFVNDKRRLSVKEMIAQCKKISNSNAIQKLGLVVIDYVQLMEGLSDESRDEELSRIVLDLKKMATELDVPVVVISQLNRDLEYRENKRPMLSDLRETESLEQHGDIVVMLYRDEYYDPESKDRGMAELIFAKHRNGPLGTVKLGFEPQFNRFKDLYPE